VERRDERKNKTKEKAFSYSAPTRERKMVGVGRQSPEKTG
jgi:hypothetical protein